MSQLNFNIEKNFLRISQVFFTGLSTLHFTVNLNLFLKFKENVYFGSTIGKFRVVTTKKFMNAFA
jgi:hypothetical protein